MSFDGMLPVAQEAVELASRMVREQRPGAVVEKGDRDLVSEADVAVERAVRTFLSVKTPDIGFLGEEEGVTDSRNGLMWALDPIDGTSNYVRGLPLCAISLALIDDRCAVLGVIDAPFLGSRYYALRGAGAHLDGAPIHTSNTRHLREAIVAMGDYASGKHADTKNRDRLALTHKLAVRVQRIRMLGTAALDLAWLAEGKLDAAVMLSNKPWDTQAGVLLAREAGATVVGRSGEPHTSDSTATIACATDALAAAMDPLIASLSSTRLAQPGQINRAQ
jgi:myo-inositol-1(or 4)-monophosphatase